MREMRKRYERDEREMRKRDKERDFGKFLRTNARHNIYSQCVSN